MPEIAPPQPRDLNAEIPGILNLSNQLTQQQSQAFQQNFQNAINTGASTWSQWMGPGGGLDVTLAGQDRERLMAIQFMQQHGLQAQQALLASNPALARSLGYVDQLNQASMQNVPEISRLLNQQALSELQLGGKLTPEEQRFAQQAAREAYAARGMVTSDAASLAEVLNRDTLAQARLQQRQAFAGSREATAMGFALPAAQLANETTFARDIFKMPTIAEAHSQSISNYLVGTQGATPNFSNLAVGSLGYVSDLYNTNLNMQASMYNSMLNNQAALQAAQIQANAQIQAAQLQAQALGASASQQASAARSAGGSALTGSLIGAGGAIAGGLIAF
jgi:hypothetical protein